MKNLMKLAMLSVLMAMIIAGCTKDVVNSSSTTSSEKAVANNDEGQTSEQDQKDGDVDHFDTPIGEGGGN